MLGTSGGDRALARRRFLGGVAGGWLAACVSPKATTDYATRLAPAPAGVALEPPPPEGVFWLRLAAARVPERAPGGKVWNASDLPDPSAALLVAGKEVLATPAVSNTLAPIWREGASANFEIGGDARLEVELRDSGLTTRPIGRGRFSAPTRGDLAHGSIRVEIGQVGNKGNVTIAVEPAHALIGLGFDYEIYDSTVIVSRVLRYSPAGRAGMRVKDEVVSVGGRRFSGLGPTRIRGMFNELEQPVEVIVRHEAGTTENFPLGEGPCYPLLAEYGPIA